jgi:hypothetical protein
MGFHTFAVGEVLTASNVNTYLMNQVVIVCTAGTRPSSPNEGMSIYETDTDRVLVYSGSAWVTVLETSTWNDYSGSLAWTSNGTAPALGNSVVVARYIRSGKLCVYTFRITFGSTATYGTQTYSFSLPVNAAATRYFVGSAYCRDASAGSTGHFTATCYIDSVLSATTLQVINVNQIIGQLVPFTWTSTDHLTVSIAYETV